MSYPQWFGPAAESTAADQDREFAELTRKISRDRGFACARYKERCLRRRIAVRMRARGMLTYGEYARLLDADTSEYDRLIDALTINVTKLFRNWSVYESLATNVIPALWSLDAPRLHVWSAGCSSGEEAYSVATLFHAHAASVGMPSRVGRVEVIGTDIDRASLAAAQRGEFMEGDFAETPPELRARYFSATTPSTIAPAVAQLVRFERRDLLEQEPPPVTSGGFHLITCRNVLIYFDRETQERLFERFHQALVPGGYLLLGKVETLLGPARTRFASIDARERIFRRL